MKGTLRVIRLIVLGLRKFTHDVSWVVVPGRLWAHACTVLVVLLMFSCRVRIVV